MRNERQESAGSGAVNRRQFIGHTAVLGMSAVASSATRAVGQVIGANERVGIGVIGAGGRGSYLANVVERLKDGGENIDIVAVCDVYRPRMEHVAEHFGAKRYMEYHELLADPNVDVVTIATPDHLHGYQAIDAVRAGKDVYCEKPVTHWRQFDLIKRLAAVVNESDRVFQLGTQGMSDSAWHQMRELVQDGLIGQPIHAECGYLRVGDWGERGMPIDDPSARPGPDLNWEAFLGDSPKRPFDVSRFFRWRMYEDYSGGPVTDLFPHSLTPVTSILGVKMPSTVVATGGKFRYEDREVPDTFNMLIDYPEKITVAVLGTQGNDYPGTGGRGAGGRIPVVRGWDGTLTVRGEKIVFTPIRDSEKKPQEFSIERREDMLEHYRNFIACCRSRDKKTNSPVGLAYYTQTALLMGMASLRSGKAARFDAAQERIVV